MVGKGAQVVGIGRLRSREFDGHIGTLEGFAVEVVAVVYIDNASYLVAALARHLLNHTAHFTVSNQCYFHSAGKVCGQK